eukprot:CAMPEP_0173179246 /NCGR_PEP_ID=MMETSP1141-20130122/6004_1 /TAXON_ID=483371 /ORGANISM="non described non described, Strain CCMP2298" /LENGTH=324 /DNA_ID=CAMNT_0014101865 /DNA_START=64 /DNA_END=1038 /DNA_ORIENTATION=+
MTSTKAEVVQLKETLQKALAEGQTEGVCDALRALQQVSMSADLLKATKIVPAVKAAKKALPKEEAVLANKLITKWKDVKPAPAPVPERVSSRESKPVLMYTADADATAGGAGGGSDKATKARSITIHAETQPLPKRTPQGLVFPDFPTFRPNLTPKEVLQMGSFGGTYFRTIQSGVTHSTHADAWREFPGDWFEGLNVKKRVSSASYDAAVNLYGVKCGGDLHMWESSGWITEADPFGWFQWYCRFYLGRRCDDDARQVGRALGVMGAKGRWRNNLINKCINSGKPPSEAVGDKKISPVVRQLLQHWGYQLTEGDIAAFARGKK